MAGAPAPVVEMPEEDEVDVLALADLALANAELAS